MLQRKVHAEMTSSDTVTIRFVDGSQRDVPGGFATRVRGLDAEGDLLVPLFCGGEGDPDVGEELLVPLTPCCDAYAKGTEAGVVCRVCYEGVAWKHGATSELVVAVAAPVSGPE